MAKPKLARRKVGRLEKLLTVGELAERLGVTQGTVYQWVSKRRIPYVKAGRRVRFNPRTIEEWLAERSRPHVPPRQRWRQERRQAGQPERRDAAEAATTAMGGVP